MLTNTKIVPQEKFFNEKTILYKGEIKRILL